MDEFALQISGAELDQRELDTVNTIARETGRKVCSIYPGENSLHLHVKTFNNEGSRRKYSIKASLTTPVGAFHAEDHEWELSNAVASCLRNLERIVIEDHQKRIEKKHKK